MASSSVALLFVLSALVLSSASHDSSKNCGRKCCTTISITCESTFVDGQNRFAITTDGNSSRIGYSQVFNGNCIGTKNGKYVGVITIAGGGDSFLIAKIEFSDGIITFVGDATSSGVGTVVYAVTGGTGRYIGISGTATEVGFGNDRYRVTISGDVETNC